MIVGLPKLRSTGVSVRLSAVNCSTRSATRVTSACRVTNQVSTHGTNPTGCSARIRA